VLPRQLLEVQQRPVGLGELIEERELGELNGAVRPRDGDGRIGGAEVDADGRVCQEISPLLWLRVTPPPFFSSSNA
jgi:hypothetical protein